MQAIVVCTLNNPGVTVLLESIRCYGDKLPVYLCSNNLGLWARAREITENLIYRPNPATNFGDAYNAAVDYAFEHGKFDSLILANDDVVLNPDTLSLMREDAGILESRGVKYGFLGARLKCALDFARFSTWCRCSNRCFKMVCESDGKGRKNEKTCLAVPTEPWRDCLDVDRRIAVDDGIGSVDRPRARRLGFH